ncbi:hypothetical protein ACFFX0_30905 [Citricoccus parietis]|uniref:Uncharacterized protein n=1 Tax=Citricoccus parietis TaxID=592307 RepID=A0ABV5G8Q7_9MICC
MPVLRPAGLDHHPLSRSRCPHGRPTRPGRTPMPTDRRSPRKLITYFPIKWTFCLWVRVDPSRAFLGSAGRRCPRSKQDTDGFDRCPAGS